MTDEILTITDCDGHQQYWQIWPNGRVYLCRTTDRETVLDAEQMTALAAFLHRAIAEARKTKETPHAM